MNSLLNYQNEKTAVKEFKDNIEEYNEISDYLQLVIRDYEELYFNKDTDAKIKQKKDNIFELQERMRKMLEEYKIADSSNRASIKDIMTFYKDELLPLYNNLQEMKYPFKDVKIVRKYPEMEEYPMYFIIQKPISFNKIDYSYGKKESQVIAYTY
jgi:DNA repair ATPase RecN